MSYEDKFGRTGNSVVDALKELQLRAQTISDLQARDKLLRSGMGPIPVEELIGNQYMITCADAHATKPDSTTETEETRIRFEKGMLFIAQAVDYNYLRDRRQNVDSITLDFSGPEVFGVGEDELDLFRVLHLQIPVLAIETCIYADGLIDPGETES